MMSRRGRAYVYRRCAGIDADISEYRRHFRAFPQYFAGADDIMTSEKCAPGHRRHLHDDRSGA